MNPEKQLEDLIIRYCIDGDNERFRKYIWAKYVLNLLLEEADSVLLVQESASDLMDEAAVKSFVQKECHIYCHSFGEISIEEASLKCDMILYVSNMRGFQRERLECIKLESKASVIFLYDYLEKEGLKFEDEFFNVLDGKRIKTWGEKTNGFFGQRYYEAIYRDKKKYLSADREEDMDICLRRLIFDYVFIKDFVYAIKYINVYIESGFGLSKNYKSFIEELHQLLGAVKSFTKKRNGHIVNYWLDALGKGEETGMLFFNGLEKKGTVFENAYTVTAITSFALKSIFLKKRCYDHESYKIKRIYAKESPLIQYLEKEGYQFQYYGPENRFEEELYGEKTVQFLPFSMMHWRMLCDMCNTEHKKFYLLHEMAETHVPYQSGNLEECFYIAWDTPKNETERMGRKQQRELGKKYLDEQLRFYQEFISEDTKQIFMSDHATQQLDRIPLKGYGTHTNLIITGKEIPVARVEGMFSYINYDLLIKYLLDPKAGIPQEMLGDYVLTEWPDLYDKTYVKRTIEKGTFSLGACFGARCCITQTEEYVLRSTGDEEYYTLHSCNVLSRVNRIKLPECAERAAYLRKLAGTNFRCLFQDDFFRYSKLLHRIWDHYVKRTGGAELGAALLRDIITRIPEGSVVAMRGGGIHAADMLSALGEDAVKIRYVIDKNKESAKELEGPGLHFEIIVPEEMRHKKIDIVIISVFRSREEIKKELMQQGEIYQIVDIYDLLEQRGVPVDDVFYEPRILPEDYEEIDIEAI